jgi:N-acetyl-gamma-glutamyl-phosphate reductase
MQDVDLVVLCLPDAAAKESVALAGENGPKILDASTAHRTDPTWTYGFPELTRDHPSVIAQSRRVSNPGCYPTGVIALLRPLVDAGLLPQDYPIVVNSVSGYSGGGKGMIEAYEKAHAEGGATPYEAYGLSLEHKHLPEMQDYSRLTRRPIFVPAVGDYRQGMLTTIPLHLDLMPGADAKALHAAMVDHFSGSPLVKVVDFAEETPKDLRLAADAFKETDLLELRVMSNAKLNQVILMARLDNLGKGASGVAVQNIRLMLGL